MSTVMFIPVPMHQQGVTKSNHISTCPEYRNVSLDNYDAVVGGNHSIRCHFISTYNTVCFIKIIHSNIALSFLYYSYQYKKRLIYWSMLLWHDDDTWCIAMKTHLILPWVYQQELGWFVVFLLRETTWFLHPCSYSISLLNWSGST